MTTGEKQSSRVAFNVVLREVVLAAQDCEHSETFTQSVQVESVDDYLSFVDPADATICLEQILSRTRSCFYTSILQFRGDYERILANAMAYNSPGHGQHAYRPIIDWAQDLLESCCEELDARHSKLIDAEKRLKDATDACEIRAQSESPRGKAKESAMSSLEALIAACEVAQAEEGLPGKGEIEFCLDGVDVPIGGCDWPFPVVPMLACKPLGAIKASKHHGHHGSSKHSSAGGRAQSGKNDAAARYRRHKSKVFIRPNKVVYLPTTFMEDNFVAFSLPVNCLMIVETDGEVQPECHTVTIKSVPRQGLSTMYCMTNVMKFQQQYLNWQILDWTKVDEGHIKIHLQSPNGGGSSNAKGSSKAISMEDSPRATKADKRKSAMYDSAAAEEDDDGEDERDNGGGVADDDGSNPEQAVRGGGQRAAKSNRRAALGRASIQEQGSGSSSPSQQGGLMQQQGSDLLDLRASEACLSPSNSSGISAPPTSSMPPGGEQVQLTQQQLHQLLLAQLPASHPSVVMQLQQMQYQQAAAAAQQQQQYGISSGGGFPYQLPMWGMNGVQTEDSSVVMLRHQLQAQQQLQQQQVLESNVRRPSMLSANLGPLPDASAQQQQQQAMMLLNQLIMSGQSTAMFSSMPAAGPIRLSSATPLNTATAEAPSAFKRYKFGSDGAAMRSAAFSSAGSGPAANGMMISDTNAMMLGPIAAALAAQGGGKQGFDGSVVQPHLQHTLGL